MSHPVREHIRWKNPLPLIRSFTATRALNIGTEEDNSSTAWKLIKSSGIYALSSLAPSLISLVLAPFLTRHLSSEMYGALAVLNTATALIAGLTQLGLTSAFFRSYNYDYETPKDRLDVVSTVVALLLLTSLFACAMMLLTAPWFAEFLFKDASFSNAVRIAALIVLLQNITIPGFAWMRAENRALFFSLLSIMSLLVSLGANILLVGMLHMGIVGSLIASGSGYTLVGICTLPAILWRVGGLHLRLDIARGLLSFGLPNVFTFVSVWILQLSDRFLLSRLGSLSQTASYSVAYSLGSLVSIVVLSPFALAWPSAMFAIAKKENAAAVFKNVFHWYSTLLLLVAFSSNIVSTGILFFLFPRSYHSAVYIIYVISISIIFYGIYNIFTTGISIQRKTWFAVVFTMLSALSNIAFNLILIPIYGSMGAALSTLFAYILLAVVAYVVNQRLYPVPYEISLFTIKLCIGIVLYASSCIVAQHQGTYKAVGIASIGLLLYGGCLLLIEKWPGRSRYS